MNCELIKWKIERLYLTIISKIRKQVFCKKGFHNVQRASDKYLSITGKQYRATYIVCQECNSKFFANKNQLNRYKQLKKIMKEEDW